MIAACPMRCWTYGFMDRLTTLFNTMADEISAIERGLLDEAVLRLERWQTYANGLVGWIEDPFEAATAKQWNKASQSDFERKIDEGEAAKQPPQGIRATVHHDDGAVDDAPDDAEKVSGGVQVLSTLAKVTGPYKVLAVNKTPLTVTPTMPAIRNALRSEFPHALLAIDLMLGDLRPGEPLWFRPLLLLGSPGCGKSRLIRRMAELTGAKIRRYDAAASSDNAFSGTPKRWASASPCFPLIAIADTKVANPILLVDELDKAPPGHWSGSLHTAMMPFLERETARAYLDICFEVEADLSHICYAMTANDDTRLPKPLKDRIRVIRVPSPGREQLEMLCVSIMKDLAVELNISASFLPPLAPDELSVIAKAWDTAGSLRQLQKIVRGTVTARDNTASRH
jgi:ATP-dependent Lon protease